MIWEKRWFQFAILMILAFIWGSSFILMKIGLKSFSSDQAAAIRIILASLLTTDLEPVVAQPGWTYHLLALAILGIFGTAVAMLLMNSLIRYSSAVTASSVTYIINRKGSVKLSKIA